MAVQKTNLLVVEDDLDIAEMLRAYLHVQGYNVVTANWGEDGVRLAQSDPPDLVILDIRLPDIDGFEVARRLRQQRRTQDIPIIFLTERRERKDRLMGLGFEAEDYITKPFDVQELRLRVRNVLLRNRQTTLTNPVTGLPEGNLVDTHLNECLKRQNWAILAVTLRNLEKFRDLYGFLASDDLLCAMVLILQNTLHEIGAPEDFLGQVGATEFVLIVAPENLVQFKYLIRKRIEQSVDYFYREQDRKNAGFDDIRLKVDMGEVLPPLAGGADLEILKAQIARYH